MAKRIGKREITKLLRDLINENPDRVNPETNGACVYDKKRTNYTDHCIAGQLVRNLGYDGTLSFSSTIEMVSDGVDTYTPKNKRAMITKFSEWLHETFTPGALTVLNEAQIVADGRAHFHYDVRAKLPDEYKRLSNKVPWKAVLYVLRNQ